MQTKEKLWFTSDWHFGDTRLSQLFRPFKNVEENTKEIVNKHNSKVAIDDLVYVLGDSLYREADPNIFLPIINSMNGRKILLRGNHDRSFSDEMLLNYFEEIIPEGESVKIQIEGIECNLNHYPSKGVENAFNLVGHIHSAFKIQLNMLNVGVDVNHFYPIESTTIKTIYDCVCGIYDEDTFASKFACNSYYSETRGIKPSLLGAMNAKN